MFSAENKLEFVFWVLRYVFTFVAFLTGMKAPGILSARDISGETDEEVKFRRVCFGQGLEGIPLNV